MDSSQNSLYLHLTSFGNYYALRELIETNHFSTELAAFANDWKPYNPRKAILREGLSLTSLDGEMTGVPDLDSIWEYNQIHGTSLNELSFRKPTRVYQELPSVSRVLKPFEPFLGRSHLIRFKRGGFFPPHRDAMGTTGLCFRLLSLLTGCSKQTLVFLLNGERVWLEPGVVYFVNTRLEHSVFSFGEGTTILVANVEVSSDSVSAVLSRLASF